MIPLSEVIVPEHRQRHDPGDINELADSLNRLGLIHPIVLNRDNSLVAGWRRFHAAKQLGWTSIDCRFIDELDPIVIHLIELEENIKRKDLTWQERHEAIIEYHRLRMEQEGDGWTEEKTADAIGVRRTTINDHVTVERERANPLVGQAETFSAAKNTARRLLERRAADEFNTHMRPDRVYTSPIIHANFLEWAPTYAGPKFNLIHCDFPYGINSDKSSYNASGYTDGRVIYLNLCKSLCINLDNFCAPSAHMIFWFHPSLICETWETLKLLDDFRFDEVPLVWHKTDQQGIAPDPQRRPRRLYEMAFFGWRNDRKIIRLKNNIVAVQSTDDIHKHEKPQLMLEYFMEMVVDAQTAFLDPTCGSGSALRAAKSLGASRVLGIESNEGFATDARRTFETYLRSSQRRPEDNIDPAGPYPQDRTGVNSR